MGLIQILTITPPNYLLNLEKLRDKVFFSLFSFDVWLVGFQKMWYVILSFTWKAAIAVIWIVRIVEFIILLWSLVMLYF